MILEVSRHLIDIGYGRVGVSRTREVVVLVSVLFMICLFDASMLYNRFVVSRNSVAARKPISRRILRQTMVWTSFVFPRETTVGGG